jgi:OFA family oxalate/formate antiporter-like MFS transporter
LSYNEKIIRAAFNRYELIQTILKMRKYSVLIAAIVVNICLGGIYAWSIFVPELVKNYGYNTTQTQIVFGTIICLLTFTILFTGRLENILGPRLMIVICGLLIFISYTAAGHSGTNFFALWLGYGVITGIAIGFGYVCVLAVIMRWFENRKGFACGMVVAGYGFGAVILSFISQAFLNRGWDVMNIFKIIGIIFGTAICICAIIIKNPDGYSSKTIAATIKYHHIIRKPRFYILAITTGLGTFPGLMILGNLKPMVLSFGYKSSIAVLAISLISMGNAFGRVAGGAMHDRFKASTIKAVLIMVSLSSLLLAGDMGGGFVFLAVILFAGVSYGGMIANIPSQVADEYGHKNFGMIYPIVFLVHGITAVIAAPLGGYIYDKYNTYQPAILIAAGIGLICLMCFSFAYRREQVLKVKG